MDFILEYIGPVLGIASAIVTLVAFFKQKIQHNIRLLAASLIFAAVIVYVWDLRQQKEYDFELLAQKQKYEELISKKENELIAKDAKTIAQSVVITGWEDYGDYLAYLATMVGFYKRHSHKYQEEYVALSRQLNEWQEHLRDMRKSGKTISFSDYEGLRGLVKSTKDYLQQIGGDS